MAQKTSQEFDSGLGSLREVEEELANGIAAIKLEEPVAKQKDQEKQRRSLVGNLESENRRLKEKLESMEVEVKQQKEQHATDARNLKDVKRQFGGQIEDLRKKHATDARNLKDVKRQFGDQIEDLRKKLAIEKENSKDVKRQLGDQMEDLRKKLAEKEAEVKELEEQLISDEKVHEDNEKKSAKEIEELRQENSRLEKKTAEQWKACNMMVRSTQPEPGYIAIILDAYARSTDPTEYRDAYCFLLDIFKEHAPERPFPSQEDLTALQVRWEGFFGTTDPPCIIKTLCDWYSKSIGDIPYAYYGFIPGIHGSVSPEFLSKIFYILHSLKYEERGQLKGALHEEKYVLCCEANYGDGHMCVVTRSNLEKMIDDQASSTITHFYICLPRGTSSVDQSDPWYIYKTFQSQEELQRLQLTENEYLVKVTTSEGDDECFLLKRRDEGYYTEWRPNNTANYTHGELYVKKGLFPVIQKPCML